MKIILSLAMLTMACTGWAKPKKTIVTVETIQETELETSLFYPVSIKSKLESQIVSDNDYIVIDILVNLGDLVKKGTPIFKLRNQDTSLDYKNRVIKAPVNGTIANIQTGKGEFIKKGTPLALINDPTSLYGRINIPSNDFSKISKGLKGSLSISSLNIKKIETEIVGVGSTVNSLTGTIPVDLELKSSQNILPGILGSVEIVLSKTKKILIKEKSIFYIGDETLIAAVDDKLKVTKIKVKLGKRYKDKIELLEGIKVGTKYVAATPKFLRNGEIVDQKKEKKPKNKKEKK